MSDQDKGVSITAQRAQEFKLPAQGKDEGGEAFRLRISGALKSAGHDIEAHEAYQNALFDNDPMVMLGITGSVAKDIQDKEWMPGDPVRQVGDDIAAGAAMSSTESKMDPDALLAYVKLFG